MRKLKMNSVFKLNMVNKRLHEKAHKHVKSAIDEIMSESLPSIGKGLKVIKLDFFVFLNFK